jgi:hypothetical protein
MTVVVLLDHPSKFDAVRLIVYTHVRLEQEAGTILAGSRHAKEAEVLKQKKAAMVKKTAPPQPAQQQKRKKTVASSPNTG